VAAPSAPLGRSHEPLPLVEVRAARRRLLIGLLYTLPNLYGEAPAVQVSSGKATVKVDDAMVGRVQQVLQAPA
jgi:hypothetical protein